MEVTVEEHPNPHLIAYQFCGEEGCDNSAEVVAYQAVFLGRIFYFCRKCAIKLGLIDTPVVSEKVSTPD